MVAADDGTFMTMISYAQNHEDVLLNRLFPPGVNGFYIDVGAFDPVLNSVTKHFYDRGWTGVNIDPASHSFDRMCAERQRDISLNIGLSAHQGSMAFFESPVDSGWSTFSPAQAEWHREKGIPFVERAVEVRTLADVCAEHVKGTISFLSVDVEGHEREVLQGGDWQRWRPVAVVVEATQPDTTVPTHEAWEEVLLKADYTFAFFDGLNRYYLRREDCELLPALSTPANVLDDFVPYAHLKEVRELHISLDGAVRQLTAARVAKESIWDQYSELVGNLAGLSGELSSLRARYENHERSLANTRAHLDSARASTADLEARYFGLQRELTEVRARLVALTMRTADVGDVGLRVARRLTRVSHRHPTAGRLLRILLRSGARVRQSKGRA